MGKAYRKPSMPLLCGVYRAGDPFPGPPRFVAPCQLYTYRHSPHQGAMTTPFYSVIKLPAGTDVRSNYQATVEDTVEVPYGSGSLWSVIWIYDVAKGFPNEFREAIIEMQTPQPAPLP